MANSIMEDIMVEVCKKRGIKLGESFKVRSNNDFIMDGDTCYRLSENGLECHTDKGDWTSTSGIEKILTGEVEIIKLPFVPHMGDEYYSVSELDKVVKCVWKAYIDDFQNYAFGNCFETKEEAEATKQKIYSELKEIYLNPTKERIKCWNGESTSRPLRPSITMTT